MKRGELIAELRGLKADIVNVRGWLDAIDVRADKMIEALQTPAEIPPAQAEPAGVPDPYAKTLADLVTPKQLGMIRALGRECGVDWEVECRSQMGCKVEELSKRAASTFIDYLKTVQEQGAGFQKAS